MSTETLPERIRSLHAAGLSADDIIKLTGYPPEAVRAALAR